MKKLLLSLVLLCSLQVKMYTVEQDLSLDFNPTKEKLFLIKPFKAEYPVAVGESVFNSLRTLSSMVDSGCSFYDHDEHKNIIPLDSSVSMDTFKLLISFIDNVQNKLFYDGYNDSLKQGFFILESQVESVKNKSLLYVELAKITDFLDVNVEYDCFLGRRERCDLVNFFIEKSLFYFSKEDSFLEDTIVAINQNSTVIELFKKSMEKDKIKINNEIVINYQTLKSFHYINPFIEGLHKRLPVQSKDQALIHTIIELKGNHQALPAFNVCIDFFIELLKHNEIFNITIHNHWYANENRNLKFNELIINKLIELILESKRNDLVLYVIEQISHDNLIIFKDLLKQHENTAEIHKIIDQFFMNKFMKKYFPIIAFGVSRIALGLYCFSLK